MKYYDVNFAIRELLKFNKIKYYDKLYMDILKEEFDEKGKTYIKNKNIK